VTSTFGSGCSAANAECGGPYCQINHAGNSRTHPWPFPGGEPNHPTRRKLLPSLDVFSGSGCRAATTPPRLRDAEAASMRSDSSTGMSDVRLLEPVASAAQARAAAERLARTAPFAGSLCAAGRGATRRSATSSTTLNRYPSFGGAGVGLLSRCPKPTALSVS
jgi:hypothetical protein